MYLDVYSDNSFETNCWLIGADRTDDAVVVDPGFSPDAVRRLLELEGRLPVAVLATHGHFDHIGAAADFCGDEFGKSLRPIVPAKTRSPESAQPSVR